MLKCQKVPEEKLSTIAKLFTSSQKTADAVGNALQLIGSATAAFTATAKMGNGIADIIDTYLIGGADIDENFIAKAAEVFSYALMTSAFGSMAIKDARAYIDATQLIDELQIFEKGRVVNDEEIEWIGDKNEPLVDEMYYFRGTTVGYPGNQSIQRLGVTPTSSDPLVATVFATNGEQYGNGVVYIASSKDLDGISQLSPNVLADEECEVVFDMQAIEFANKASINVSSAEARSILRDLGYDVPSYIPRENMSTLFTRFPKLKQEEIIKFVKAVGG